MMKSAIIIFVRNPEAGKVKTRLARDIGDEAALNIYVQLLNHTQFITRDLACDKFVFYANAIIEDDIWVTGNYRKEIQSAGDLGEKMQHAFQLLFHRGYEKVIIIGSDCPELTTGLINQAFDFLNQDKVVIGPAADGGYYLLGMTFMIEELFKNKHWSTASVYADSLAYLNKKAIQVSLLPVLQDIDTMEDLIQLNYSIHGRY